MNINRLFQFPLAVLAALLPIGVLAAVPPMCFSDVTIRPGAADPPKIDGTITGDIGWFNSWRYVFNNGTYVHDAVIQGVKDASNLYLSFEVNSDDGVDRDDLIVITIDPSPGGAGVPHYIKISPFRPGLNDLQFWTSTTASGSGTAWTNVNPVSLPTASGSNAKGDFSGPAGNISWRVEVKLAMAEFGIPPAGDFHLYVNLMPSINSLSYQSPWPSRKLVMSGDPTLTPELADWGAAKTNATSCNGVYIETPDIRTENNPVSKILTASGAVNKFHAIAHNTSLDSSGNPVTANNVRATYKIANFGLAAANAWKQLPPNGGAVTNNPTLEQSIAGNSSADFQTQWTLSPAEITNYTAHSHQCILVELDSSKGACVGGATPNAACSTNANCGTGTCEPTLFSVQSMYRNMDFAPLSTYRSEPEINTDGMDPPTSGTHQIIDLLISKQLDKLDRGDVQRWLAGDVQDPAANSPNDTERRGERGQSLAAGSGSWDAVKQITNWPVEQNENFRNFASQLDKLNTQVTQLTYLVRGCRHSGLYITVNSHNYEICDAVGAFGYVLRHAGIGVAKWSAGLAGPGLKRMPGEQEQYQISIETGKAVRLAAAFSADDDKDGPRRWWWLILIVLALVAWYRKFVSAP